MTEPNNCILRPESEKDRDRSEFVSGMCIVRGAVSTIFCTVSVIFLILFPI